MKDSFVREFSASSGKYQAGVRWQLPLGNCREEELIREMEAFARAGIGLVEVTATGYPKGAIPDGLPHAGEDYADVYGMGSAAWSKALQTILRAGNRLGIRVDFHVSVDNGSNKHVPGLSPNEIAASQRIDYVAAPVEGGKLPAPEKIAPEKATYADNATGEEKPLAKNLVAALLVKVVERGRIVPTLYQQDGTIPRQGGYGVLKFDAEIDVIHRESIVDVTELYKNGGSFELSHYTLEAGDWQVMAFYSCGDRRSVPGVTKYPSYRINYFHRSGAERLMAYYRERVFRLGQMDFEDMEDLLRENGGCIFADSYGADSGWTHNLPAEFERRKGYSMIPYLPALFFANGLPGGTMRMFARPEDIRRKGFAFSDGSEREFLNDYREIMTKLYIDEDLIPLREMCGEMGLGYRDQVVYATSRLDMIEAAAYVDIAEGESLNMVDGMDYYNAMAAASHITGAEIVSSEHGATFGPKVGCYAYPIKMALDQANRAFAGGINQLILHYYTYNDLEYPGEKGAMWPGFSAMGPFFADSWRDNSPKWESIRAFTDYAGRMGLAMRTGRLKRDIAIYKQSYWWPRHQQTLWADSSLREAGYTYDFISTGLMTRPEAAAENGVICKNGAAYKAFVFDATDAAEIQDVERSLITLAALKKIREYMKAGVALVFAGGLPRGLQGITTPAEKAEFEEIISEIRAYGKKRVVENQAQAPAALMEMGIIPDAMNKERAPITSLHMREDGLDLYWLYNCSNNYVEGVGESFYNCLENCGVGRKPGGRVSADVSLNASGRVFRLDLWSGDIAPLSDYETADGRTVVRARLDKNDAMLLAICHGDANPHARIPGASVVEKSGRLFARREIPGAPEITNWTVEIESWTNESPLDSTGPEASLMKKEKIGPIALEKPVAWDDLPDQNGMEMKYISGTGTYRAEFEIPEGWEGGLVLAVSGHYDAVAISVNGEKIPPVNQLAPSADISPWIRPGRNTLEIFTASTLSNALARLRPDWYPPRLNSYGVAGPVTLKAYADEEIRKEI